MAFRMHGVHAPHYKNTAGSRPERIPTPPEVIIPMSMHIGTPAKPTVKVGQNVKIGQLIGLAEGFVSSSVFASVSGTVKRIENVTASNGRLIEAVVIESDGKDERYEDLKLPEVKNMKDFLDVARESGVVGLGGAGFPTFAKFTLKDLESVDTIIVNGAECEPYITSDTRTMVDDPDLVWEGVNLVKMFFRAKRIIIGIEDNKPQCIEIFRGYCKGESGVEVAALPAMYPQGGEKVLIYNTTGRIVPEGKLPFDVGVIVINCTTLASLARYIRTGMPLVEKYVTVDGPAILNPKNVIAPIGTPVKYLLEYCGLKKEVKKLIYGGPMMGIALPDGDAPVLKMTNAVIAFSEEEALPPKETACIKCGRCVKHCPLKLMPVEIERAYNLNEPEELEKLKVNICMECGCCSYVCPAKRPLVQVNRLAKAMLREYQAAKKSGSN